MADLSSPLPPRLGLLRLERWSLGLLEGIILFISIAAPVGLVYMFGFPQDNTSIRHINTAYQLLLLLMWLAWSLRIWLVRRTKGPQHSRRSRQAQYILRILYGLLTFITISSFLLHFRWFTAGEWTEHFNVPWVVIATLLSVSLLELARGTSGLLTRRINPAIILAGGFLLFIAIGSLLLLLPEATYHGISYIDSLFTATSAVCVTGLSSVGTPETFTLTGQVIILLLIQVGGLGIMTITSFFTLFFMGQTSLKSQLLLRDLMSGEQIGRLGYTLIKIIGVTLSIEAVGALLLYSVVEGRSGFSGQGDALFFSFFHSVSAFCNAGFSTLSGNLYDPAVRHLWGIPTIVSWLVIFGGIGFPIFSNFLAVSGRWLKNCIRLLFGRPIVRRPHQWSLNSYIVLRTTALLLLFSWSFVLIAEWNHSLAEFSLSGKLAQGFLAAVTPRTAGFNGVNLQQMLPVTLLLTTGLMWIGGAPQSTAGGIKVTTLYLAVRNVIGTIRGEKNIEVHKREIPPSSVRRAFAVVMGSMLILVVAIGVLVMLEPTQPTGELAFEAVSALGTVGLSLGLTPELGAGAKTVLIFLMFIGRVGAVSLLAAIIKMPAELPYTFPQEDILIN